MNGDGRERRTAALVDQVTSGGRLARVDVADDDDVDVSLLLLTVRVSVMVEEMPASEAA